MSGEHEEEREDREVEDMEKRSEQLQQEIEETQADWEAKKSDATVPGAQDRDEETGDGPPPEADVITPGD
jgi:hypothetical protein